MAPSTNTKLGGDSEAVTVEPRQSSSSKCVVIIAHLLMTFAAVSFGGYNVFMEKVTNFTAGTTPKEKYCKQTAFIFCKCCHTSGEVRCVNVDTCTYAYIYVKCIMSSVFARLFS